MTMSVEVPADVQPFIRQAIANGSYTDEQEVVTDILHLAAPALENYRQLKARIEQSEAEGLDVEADFDAVRRQLRDTYNQSGHRK